jgi:hypothetical protein
MNNREVMQMALDTTIGMAQDLGRFESEVPAITALRSALEADQGTTHADGCHMWGPKHYQCALNRIAALEAEPTCRENKEESTHATRHVDSIDKLEAEPQDPVAWAETNDGGIDWGREVCFSDDPSWFDKPIPLYTSPQPSNAAEIDRLKAELEEAKRTIQLRDYEQDRFRDEFAKKDQRILELGDLISKDLRPRICSMDTEVRTLKAELAACKADVGRFEHVCIGMIYGREHWPEVQKALAAMKLSAGDTAKGK